MASVAERRVFVTFLLPSEALSQASLAADSPITFECWNPVTDGALTRAVLLDRVRGAAGLLCTSAETIDASLLESAGKSLRVIATCSVGLSHVDLAACAAHGVRVGYTPGVLTDATADLVLALTLATARRLPEAAAAVRDGSWTAWSPFWLVGKDVYGATVGIVGGSGRIGSAVAHRFHGGFDCPILYSNRSGPDAELDARCGATWAPLDDLLRRADIVVVLCALTPETRGLLSAEKLALLKPDALFVNAARGGVVDQAALAALLRARPGMKAGLDVTTPEPLPLDSELLALPNCLVLPHIGSAGERARGDMVRLCLENTRAGLDGRPLAAEAPAHV